MNKYILCVIINSIIFICLTILSITLKIGRTQFVRELSRLQLKNNQLKERIDKAIEHIEVKQFREINENDYVLDGDDLEDIKEILKGEND